MVDLETRLQRQSQLDSARLYGILDLGYVPSTEMEKVCLQMVEGGIAILQLRAKKAPPEQVADLARPLVTISRDHGVPLIINDHPSVAAEVGADGVHIGQDDGPIDPVRDMVGSDVLIGRSTHSLSQASAAVEEGADYIGFGPLFATPTKPDYTAIGTAEIAEVHRRVDLPIFCIGGIKAENLTEVVAAGAKRVVIVSGILQADDIPLYIGRAQAILSRVTT